MFQSIFALAKKTTWGKFASVQCSLTFVPWNISTTKISNIQFDGYGVRLHNIEFQFNTAGAVSDGHEKGPVQVSSDQLHFFF